MKLPQTFAEVKRQVQMQEGTSYPGKALVAMELQPGYDRAKSTMIGHMLAINEAHLLMLIDRLRFVQGEILYWPVRRLVLRDRSRTHPENRRAWWQLAPWKKQK